MPYFLEPTPTSVRDILARHLRGRGDVVHHPIDLADLDSAIGGSHQTVGPAHLGPSRAAQAVQMAAAEAYARKRLQQLVAAGLLGGMPTNTGPGGLAAVWRALSGSLASPAAGAGYGDPGYWLRMGAPSRSPGAYVA